MDALLILVLLLLSIVCCSMLLHLCRRVRRNFRASDLIFLSNLVVS
jgi:hypothetical protein